MNKKDNKDDAAINALLAEIGEEVKEKQIIDFFKRYGGLIIAGVLAVVVGTAGFNIWVNDQAAARERDSAKLISLIDADTGNLAPDEVKATLRGYLDTQKEASATGHKILARFAEVSLLLKQGERETALTRLAELRADNSVNMLYRDYALLLAARARMDKDDAQKVLDDMKPLLTNGNAWQLPATETAAVLYAKAGQKDKAIEHLQMIVEAEGIPASARERAAQLLHLYKAGL